MSEVVDTRTFSTAAEAKEFLKYLSECDYRIVGAPGTDTWLAKHEDATVVIRVEVRDDS